MNTRRIVLGLLTAALAAGVDVAWPQTQAPANQSQQGVDQFMSDLMTCAGGANLNVSGELLGSIKEIYSGKRVSGEKFQFSTVGQFLALIPEKDRLEAYKLYTTCIGQRSGERSQPAVTVRSAAAFLEHKDAVTYERYLSSDEKNTHTIFGKLNLRFKDDVMNNPAIFRSFDSVSGKIKDNPNSSEIRIKVSSPGCRFQSASHDLQCQVVLDFSSKPMSGTSISLEVGPAAFEFSLRDDMLLWAKDTFDAFDYKVPWAIAYVDINWVLDRPNWLIISDAEELTGVDGIKVLRAIVNNPTDQGATLKNLVVRASYPNQSGVSCFAGDTPQEISLDWERIVRHDPNVGTTELHGVPVVVNAVYNPIGLCSPYYLGARVPIDEAVQAHGSVQVIFKLKQAPPSPGASSRSGPFGLGGSFGLNAGSVPGFLDWPKDISISAGEQIPVKPDQLEVRQQ